jgi:hypothetical protein
MKFVHMSMVRSLTPVLFVTSTMLFSLSNVAHAQYDASGQGSSASGSSSQGTSAGTPNGQNAPTSPSRKDPYDVTKEKMDTGYVDQKKRDERNKDGASPSQDPHVPEFRKDKEGKPMADPSKEQGGPIGPN